MFIVNNYVALLETLLIRRVRHLKHARVRA